MPNWKKVIVSGSNASLNSITVSSGATVTGSLTVTGSSIIHGPLTVGSSSTGASENTLTLGPAPAGGTGEGGQLGLNAVGGTYTSASFIDNWQNYIRILRGTNASSDALVAQWNLHSKQMVLPAYTGAGSFSGTATAALAVDSSGNVITISTTGAPFPFTGSAEITGSLRVTGPITASGPIYSLTNGGLYFQGGDDAALYDVNIANTLGVYGVQDSTVGSIKLGSGGGVISGKSGFIGFNTIVPLYMVDINANGGTGARIYSGSLAVGNIAPSATVGRIDASNDVVAFSTSDSRLKTNIKFIESPIEKITQIGGYTFDWKSDPELVKLHGFEGHDIGVIAEEIEKVLPEVVTTRESGYKAVKYEKIVPLLIEAIKELKAEVDRLKSGNYNNID